MELSVEQTVHYFPNINHFYFDEDLSAKRQLIYQRSDVQLHSRRHRSQIRTPKAPLFPNPNIKSLALRDNFYIFDDLLELLDRLPSFMSCITNLLALELRGEMTTSHSVFLLQQLLNNTNGAFSNLVVLNIANEPSIDFDELMPTPSWSIAFL